MTEVVMQFVAAIHLVVIVTKVLATACSPIGNLVELSDSRYVINYVGSEMAIAQSKTIEFQAYLDDNEQIAWDCTGGSLQNRHRPSMCRDQSSSDY